MLARVYCGGIKRHIRQKPYISNLQIEYTRTEMTHTVLIVEDQTIASRGVRFTLENIDSLTILEDASTCNKARSIIAADPPDIVILDVFLTDGSGLEILSEIKSQPNCSTRVLIYSGQANPQEFAKAMSLNVDGLLSKSDPPDELIRALKSLIAGREYISHTARRMLALSMEANLTQREQQILQQLSQGDSNLDIAQRFGISDATVKKHRENILQKLNVSSTTAAVHVGLRLGLVDINAR